jgi:kinetochore protein Mis13/DSN1
MGRLKVEEDESESKDLTLRPRPKEDLGLILGALSRVERR